MLKREKKKDKQLRTCLCTEEGLRPDHQVESRLLLDVVVHQGANVLQLLPGEDEPLLIGWNPLLVQDLGLHILDRGCPAAHPPTPRTPCLKFWGSGEAVLKEQVE